LTPANEQCIEMNAVIHITTLDLPALEPYQTLRETTQHWQRGFFVAEGDKVVRQVLASRLDVLSLLLSVDWYQTLEERLRDRRFAATNVYVAPDALLEEITGMTLHKKILAVGRIPDNPTLDSLSLPVTGSRIHVALEGIADAENMGVITRNCAAFGVESLLTGADSSTPWLRRSVRVSMGTLFGLRTHRSDDIVQTLETQRREHGWRIVGTTPRGGVTSVREAEDAHAGPLCLFFGSEGGGLSDRALDVCDARFTIPMRGGVDSINVANALAVCLYDALRER
jgi:tRNA G18 (ribose-2'-O)-methylase SpoU